MISYNSINQYLGARLSLSYEDAMSASNEELREMLFTHKVLVFENWNNLLPRQVTEFSRKFGQEWPARWYADHREAARIDGLGRAYTDYTDKSYARLFSGIPWHVDIANEPGKPRYPARILYCVATPTHFTGLSTDVSSMAAAYNNLSPDEKTLFDNSYLIYQSWQQPGTYVKELPAVEIHPYTKEKFLRLNAVSQENGWIRGWYTLNPDGTKKHLDNEVLKKYVKDLGDKYQYVHNWKVGDLIIFDNWATMHRKGEGEVFEDSTGVRKFIRISIDTKIDPEFNYGNTDTK